MAVRNVVKIGDDILRKKSKPVVNFDEKLHELLDDMWETMHLNEGMGLAAVQVGVLKQVIIIEVNNMKAELINPVIISQEGKDVEKEGCLSVGKTHDWVERPYKVTVQAYDREGYQFTLTGEKWLARCLCHEIDHLHGVLYVDKTLKK